MMDPVRTLERVVAAWESLPEGQHGALTVEAWLRDTMKPAIDEARLCLKSGVGL